jgi:hypothetical protein
MTPFYLCSNPAVVMPPEVAGCVCAFKKPLFFAMVERLGPGKACIRTQLRGRKHLFFLWIGW